MVYGSAAKSVLARLDIIQTKALRICTGAMRSSPVCSLQVETGEMPLCLRRKQLQANYWVNLMGQRCDHPVKITIQTSWEREVASLSSFGWTGEAVAQEMSIHDKNFCPGGLWPSVPLWQLEVPNTDLEILGIKSDNPEANLVYEFQCHIRERYQEHIIIFTDGSKDQETGTTGAAFVVQRWNVQAFKRTSNFLSVFTVELYAILMAVQWTEQIQNHKVLICSDCRYAICRYCIK